MKSVSAALFAAATLLGVSSACSVSKNYIVTFYGFPDNSPPGPGTAHNCGGRNFVAGGVGTFSDPLTIATAPGELSVCEIIYIPLLKKYGRYEDDCEQCTTDHNNGQNHIDIWTGSTTTSGGQSQIDCEDNLTLGGRYNIVRSPASTYAVDQTSLFVPPSTCHTGSVYSSNKATC